MLRDTETDCVNASHHVSSPSLLQDVLFCTVEVLVDSNGQNWKLDNYGCTIPAPIRERLPGGGSRIITPTAEPEEHKKNRLPIEPVDNDISDSAPVPDYRPMPKPKRASKPTVYSSQYRPVYQSHRQYPIYQPIYRYFY